jgi:hypothetical protein
MRLLNTDKIKDLYFANILYEIHTTLDKIKFFENKYDIVFNEFEKIIESEDKENFEHWDDYLEWKGFQKKYKELISEKEDIENGNYKIS